MTLTQAIESLEAAMDNLEKDLVGPMGVPDGDDHCFCCAWNIDELNQHAKSCRFDKVKKAVQAVKAAAFRTALDAASTPGKENDRG